MLKAAASKESLAVADKTHTTVDAEIVNEEAAGSGKVGELSAAVDLLDHLVGFGPQSRLDFVFAPTGFDLFLHFIEGAVAPGCDSRHLIPDQSSALNLERVVFGGDSSYVPLLGPGTVRLMMPRNTNERLLAKVVYMGPLPAPVTKGAPRLYSIASWIRRRRARTLRLSTNSIRTF